MSNNVYLTLILPPEVEFRANVLCYDVESVNETDFKLNDLITMLWQDFLKYVRKSQDIKGIYKLLLEYDQGTHNVRVKDYQRDDEEVLPLYPMNRHFPNEYRDDETIQKFYCKMDRQLALRGEVLLADIAEVYPKHPLTFERVLEILLIDFINKYKKGEAKNILVLNT